MRSKEDDIREYYKMKSFTKLFVDDIDEDDDDMYLDDDNELEVTLEESADSKMDEMALTYKLVDIDISENSNAKWSIYSANMNVNKDGTYFNLGINASKEFGALTIDQPDWLKNYTIVTNLGSLAIRHKIVSIENLELDISRDNSEIKVLVKVAK